MLDSFHQQVTIKLSSQQQNQLKLATGTTRSGLVLNSLHLVGLILAAEEAGVSSIPLSTKDTTVRQMLEYQQDLHNAPAFFLQLDLTREQKSQIQQLSNKAMSAIIVAPDEWTVTFNQNWSMLGGAFCINKSMVIVPPGVDYQAHEGERTIILPPTEASGNVFGTGTHPSTQLILMFLEKYIKSGDKVLDLGTGSGILALAAARYGAQKVLALDIDPTAVATAAEAVRLNQLSHVVEVARGSIEAAEQQSYDVVIANLLPNCFLSLAPALASSLKSPGRLIASGIVKPRVKDVSSILLSVGLIPEEESSLDNWHGLVFRNT